MYIAQLDKEHNFAYEIDWAVRGRLKKYVVDEANAITSFDWNEGHADQIRSITRVEDAHCWSSYDLVDSNAHVDHVILLF